VEGKMIREGMKYRPYPEGEGQEDEVNKNGVNNKVSKAQERKNVQECDANEAGERKNVRNKKKKY